MAWRKKLETFFPRTFIGRKENTKVYISGHRSFSYSNHTNKKNQVRPLLLDLRYLLGKVDELGILGVNRMSFMARFCLSMASIPSSKVILLTLNHHLPSMRSLAMFGLFFLRPPLQTLDKLLQDRSRRPTYDFRRSGN